MRKRHEQGRSARTAGASSSLGRIWFARAMVAAVFLLNVMCAVQFVLWPDVYAPAYGLPPTPESAAMVAGLGVAFLMWNVTYPAVIADPVRFRALFVVVLVQQLVGLVGESWILLQLANAGLGDGQMAQGILRFIAFDAGGLVAMLAGFVATQRNTWLLCRGSEEARDLVH